MAAFEGTTSGRTARVCGQMAATTMASTLGTTIGRRHRDRKSTRLNSSHVAISYAAFCMKKKTSRPEYAGALTRVHGAQTIALAPLGHSDTAALLGELLGSDPSVGQLAAIIAERAGGNPFFAV